MSKVHCILVHVDMPDEYTALDAESVAALGVARELSTRKVDGNVRAQHIGVMSESVASLHGEINDDRSADKCQRIAVDG